MIDFVDKPFYSKVSDTLACARSRTYAAVNAAMVDAYWNIGKSIVEKQSKLDRAEYGEQLIEQLSEKMVKDFGKGFDVTNLRNMRQFYLAFPDHSLLCTGLSWTHYRMIIRIKDDKARLFYMNVPKDNGVQGSFQDKSIQYSMKDFPLAKIRKVSQRKSIL